MSRRDLVVFSLVLACLAFVFLVRPRDEEVVELRETQGFPSDSGILVSSEPVESVGPVNSYELGYQEGYRAFLSQQSLEMQIQGVDVPSDVKDVVYVVGHVDVGGDVGVEDEELRGRGYMDGYHRASESVGCRSCPY